MAVPTFAPPKPRRRLYSGFDLGQAADFTALAVCEQLPRDDPSPRRRWRYEVRHLQRWPLGTDYTAIAADAALLYARPPLPYTTLAVDYTGVGRPVVDQLRAERIAARLIPVLITGGNAVTEDADTGEWHVPKRDLVSTTVALFQSQLVRVRVTGPEAERLRKELAVFTAKVNRRTANEQFGAWADGQHDDLVLALMLALYAAEHLGAGEAGKVSVQPADQSAVGAAPPGVFL